MGLMCSWIAVKGASREALLNALDLVETDEPREALPGCRDVNFCYQERPDGWTVLASEDFDWASPEQILQLSHLGPTVGLQFEDKVEMTSIATGAKNGVELWRVSHVNDPKKMLEVRGTPPAQFAEIRDQRMKEQEEHGGDESSTDYLHDIPLDVAKAACGYRLDENEEPFLALKPVGAEDEEADYGRRVRRPKKPGDSNKPLFGLLFGLFRRK